MSVLRLLTVYNERDIIRENIEYYISQGIETVVLDNYSKDGTYEILKEYEGKGIRWIERYKSKFYDIVKINTILLRLAFKEPEKYFIWIDADEILTLFDERLPLKLTIIKLFSIFDVDCFSASKIEFYHTEKSKILEEKNYSFKDFNYFIFERNWKNVVFKKDFRIRTYVDKPYYIDENNKEIPHKVQKDIFFLKHYPFRTYRQAKKKVYRGLPLNNSPNALNAHYRYFKENMLDKIVRPKETLIRYENYPFFLADFMTKSYPELTSFYDKLYEKLLGG